MHPVLSILEVNKKSLCCGCGNCVAACPSGSLGFKHTIPFMLDRERCTGCRGCISVCPAIHTLDKPSILNCYSAYSTDRELRWNASSGGFVTQFLLNLLEQDVIDGAIVCDYRDDIFYPQAVVATSREELTSAVTSKYCPVPMNLALKDIGIGRFAFVGLPCHIKGLRLRQKTDSSIYKSITLTLGLFCNHTPDFNATDFLLYSLKINKKDVQRICYRGKGWPGVMQITLKDGQIVQVSNAWDTGFGKYFVPNVCSKCTDMFSDYADVSAGDPWLKEYESDAQGTTLVIVRNAHVNSLIEECSSLSVKQVSYDIIQKSQKDNIKMKRIKNGRERWPFSSRLGKYKFLWRYLFWQATKGGGVVVNRKWDQRLRTEYTSLKRKS